MKNTLSKENLKRIVAIDHELITLDEDGVFDLWVRDVDGEIKFDEHSYAFHSSILPNKLFEILKRNVRLEVA